MTRPPLYARVEVAAAAGDTMRGTVIARSLDLEERPYCTVRLDRGEMLMLFDHHLRVIQPRAPLRLATINGVQV